MNTYHSQLRLHQLLVHPINILSSILFKFLALVLSLSKLDGIFAHLGLGSLWREGFVPYSLF
jgi:hypothetical protein